ncbi:MAG: OmpH family outer membrane protein, partial [Bacteroidota bacterium]
MKRTPILAFITLATLISSCQEKNQVESVDTSVELATDSVTEESLGLNVAFIYGDTINEKYKFLIDAQDELEKEQRVIEERINRKLRKAENRAMELQKQAATMTQLQVQEAQLELQNLDLEIQQFQEKLATEFRKREIELQNEYTERVDKILDEYNKEGVYDIILNFQVGGNLLWIKDKFDIT